MRPVLVFFSLTYVASWSCFAVAAVLAGGKASSSPGLAVLAGPLFLLGTFAPAFVALALTARAGGRASVLALLRQMLNWRVGWRWYAFAAGYMAAIKIAVALVYRIVTGGWPAFGHEPFYIILAAMILSTPVQAGEEIGWRGYALPRLAERLGLARASLLLGVIWACWHLPFFFIPGADKSGQSFPVYLLQVTALSVAAACLYWRTHTSLLLVMLLHSATNQSTGIVPSTVSKAVSPIAFSTSLVAWLTVALLWVAAGWFLARMRNAVLQRSP
jgi:membrane protease YdiL (CAAX protease family)